MNTNIQYGGFWIRLLAYIIDGVIIGVGLNVIHAIFFPGFFDAGGPANTDIGAIVRVLNLIAVWLYFALLESSTWQATIGKRLLHLRVARDETQERLTFLRATGRFFAKILSGIILFIGFIMIAFTAKKQGLHDKIAGTIVYRTPTADTPPATEPPKDQEEE